MKTSATKVSIVYTVATDGCQRNFLPLVYGCDWWLTIVLNKFIADSYSLFVLEMRWHGDSHHNYVGSHQEYINKSV